MMQLCVCVCVEIILHKLCRRSLAEFEQKLFYPGEDFYTVKRFAFQPVIKSTTVFKFKYSPPYWPGSSIKQSL